MADPVSEPKPKKAAAAPLPSSAPAAPVAVEEPDTLEASQLEAKAIAENQAMNLRRARRGEATVILPGGQRRSAAPLAKARYQLNQHTQFLAEPETILTEEWLARHPGWKYEWPILESNETKSYLRAKWFKLVEPEALRHDNPFAMVGDAVTAHGNAITWMRHVLVAVPPEVWRRRHVEPAEYALARTAEVQESGNVDALNAAFGSGGWAAEAESSVTQE